LHFVLHILYLVKNLSIIELQGIRLLVIMNSTFADNNFYIRNRTSIHVLSWLLYYLFWVSISGGISLKNLLINSIFLSAQIGAVYTCTAWLMPKLLYKKRIISFIPLLVATVILFAALLAFGLKAYFDFQGWSDDGYFSFPTILGPTLGSVGTATIFALVAKLVKDNYINERRAKAFETEKLQQEIKFLRSQLDPHFLFNALNNIYWQIKKEPDAAADSLAKFSDMLRYQLYECNADKMSLQKEVDYLHNYLEVAKLSYGKEVDVKINIDNKLNGQQISPLLLIPFAENAIKHLGKSDKGLYINVDLKIDQEKLDYVVKNSKAETIKTKEELRSSGIGMKNIERRLKLLYPDKHNLKIQNGEEEYVAHLQVEL